MPETYMRGHRKIRDAIVTFIKTELPNQTDLAKESWLPVWPTEQPLIFAPSNYDSYNPYEVNSTQFPQVGVDVVRSNNYRRRNITNTGSKFYVSSWQIVIGLAHKSMNIGADDQDVDIWQDRRQTMDSCHDLTSIVLGMILQKPSCGTAESEDIELIIQEETIQVDYPDAVRPDPKNPRWIAATRINATVTATELAVYKPLGIVEQAEAEVRRMQ